MAGFLAGIREVHLTGNAENITNTAESQNSLVCVSCQTSCAPTQKFCLKCGESLWLACPECGEDTPVNSGFCGSCGCDLREVFKEGDDFFARALEEAKSKAADLDLNAAIRVLLSAADSPKLQRKTHKSQLMELVKNYRLQKSEYKADAEDRFNKAKLLIEKSSLAEAKKVLSEIPAPLRSAEAEELLQSISQQMSESKRLSGQLEEMIQKKDLVGALPVIKGLLAYRPNDQKLTKLASDIVKKVAAKVEQLKQTGKFKEAYALIRRVGEFGSSSKTNELKEEIGEIVWLTNYVQKVQEVDRGLASALEQLAQRVPTAENKKYLDEAKKRLAASNLAKPASWSPVPKQPVFGSKILVGDPRKAIEGFESINLDGCTKLVFAVATGLAMQGVGQSALAVDLSPKKGGFLGFGGKKTAKSAWGLDFGQSSLKAVKLSTDSNNLTLESVDRFPYRNVNPTVSSNEHRSNMLEALLRFKSKHDVKKDEIVNISLNPGQVLARYLSLPDTDAKAFKAALEFEVKLQIPFPLDEIYWDSHVFPKTAGDKRLAVVAAARKNDVDLVSDMFSANGIKLGAIQSESLALYNFGQLLAQKHGSDSCDAYLDIGYVQSTFTVVSHSRVWFRTFSVGTDSFVKALCRKLKCNSEQAEKIIRDFSNADSQIAAALMSMSDPYRDLVAEINRSIQAFEADANDYPQNIFVIGGGAKLHGMTTYLRHDVKTLTVD